MDSITTRRVRPVSGEWRIETRRGYSAECAQRVGGRHTNGVDTGAGQRGEAVGRTAGAQGEGESTCGGALAGGDGGAESAGVEG